MLGSYLARLIVTSAGSALRGRAHPLDETRMRLFIWPTDVDIYGHMNNGRYLTLMDQGRFDYTLRTGLGRMMFQRRWVPKLGAASIRFKRELRPFQRCELVTRIVYWDSKWFYFEQRFESAEGVHSTAYVKGVLKKGRQTIPPDELFRSLGVEAAAPPMPPELQSLAAP